MLDGQEESGVVVFLVVLLHKVFRRGPTQGKEDKGPNGICPLGNGNKKKDGEKKTVNCCCFFKGYYHNYSPL